ncbi:MAG: RlmE family RNA methyltransferase, partial [Burkholderiaceae bacterium]
MFRLQAAPARSKSSRFATGKNKTNRAWVQRHVTDPYVRQAQQKGYRSRAAFKLLEIDQKDRLLKSGQYIIDLGSAPGSWSQVLRERVGGQASRILAIDLLPMDPVAGVEFLQGDFREPEVVSQINQWLEGRRVDLVLSDMAPNLSGVGVADAARVMHLGELALEFAAQQLK